MKALRIGIIGMVLLMLLLSISAVYSQQTNGSDQTLINSLDQLRVEMLQKLCAIIPVKEHFASIEATGAKSCAQNGVLKSCTYTFSTGQVLSETKDASGYLVNDSFQDPINHLVLNTEYTLYNRPLCYTLIDTLKLVVLKVCYACGNNTTCMCTSWQNQTLRNYTSGDTLLVKANCCGNIIKMSYEKDPGMAFARKVSGENNILPQTMNVAEFSL